jgi:hypothetical protein
VDSILPRDRGSADQAQIDHADARGVLERVSRSLASHQPGGEAAQFSIHDSEEPARGIDAIEIPSPHICEELRDLASLGWIHR